MHGEARGNIEVSGNHARSVKTLRKSACLGERDVVCRDLSVRSAEPGGTVVGETATFTVTVETQSGHDSRVVKAYRGRAISGGGRKNGGVAIRCSNERKRPVQAFEASDVPC